MNALISRLVALLSVAIVLGGAAWCVQSLLGELAVLAWVGLGFLGFLGLMAKVNS